MKKELVATNVAERLFAAVYVRAFNRHERIIKQNTADNGDDDDDYY